MTRVAVVGGGAAGALQALHLKRAGIADIVLIERARAPGRGVAYSTSRPEHLLNVPARRMSALADDPDHFTRWFAARAGGGEEDFAPRMLYGDYLAGLLAEAGIEALRGEAVDLADGAVVLAGGGTIAADRIVLAPGNLKPATPPGIDPEALGALWFDDPWAEGIADGLGRGDVVLLLGTGLTAVDAALTLEAAGFPGRIVALSRRGLAPRAHGPREPMVAPCEELPAGCTAMLRRVRARAGEIGWRSAVHELRTVTSALWGAAGEAERRRFLRHLRPWWDVHRHKIAPAVGAAIEAMQGAAKLSVAAGKLVSAEAGGGRAVVRFRARGRDDVETLRVARIVNCTGPELHIVRSGEPLLLALVTAGRIRPDPLKIGIDVDRDCRTLDAEGKASDSLYAIGPVTRGTFWESVAVPDIRTQAARVAERIAAAS
ncbi:MAG TPA: FAD/NAD(P)-binding protein [Allosphingosinicella sp.]|nr:FAD/NAD(P)-binding protein [Allosphingosinicella sp.]